MAAETLGVKSFIEITQSCTVYKINALLSFIQTSKMAAKKCWENDLWQNVPYDSLDTLGMRILLKSLYPALLLRKIGVFFFFLHFMQHFKIATKMAGKPFWEKLPDDCGYPGGQKFHQNHSFLHRFRDVFLPFMQNFKMTSKNDGKTIFGKKFLHESADTLGVKNFVEIALSHTVSEICKTNTF